MTHYIKNEKIIARSYQITNGYIFEVGGYVETHPNPLGIGYVLPYFNAYRHRHCDTKKELKRCIKELGNVEIRKEGY